MNEQCYYCIKCQTHKSEIDFHKSTRNRCKECVAKYDSDKLHRDPVKYKLRAMIKGAKRRARNQNVPFDLDSEWLITEFSHLTHCPAIGIKFEWISKKVKSPNSPTLDKFIPEKGYIKGNVHVISSKANQMKSNSSGNSLIGFARWILQHSLP